MGAVVAQMRMNRTMGNTGAVDVEIFVVTADASISSHTVALSKGDPLLIVYHGDRTI